MPTCSVNSKRLTWLVLTPTVWIADNSRMEFRVMPILTSGLTSMARLESGTDLIEALADDLSEVTRDR